MANNASSSTKVITGEVRFSFVHLFEPHAALEGQEPKYSVQILVPKSDKATIRKIRNAQKAAREAGVSSKWGGTLPKNLKDTFRDGDEDGDPDTYPEQRGHYFLNVSSSTRPGVVDKDVNPILDATEVYSGCYGRVSINAFPYSANGNKGVSFGLQNVQKTRDGESLTGMTNAEDDFDEWDDDEYADDDDML